jgi:hypothetical protein
MMSAAAAVNPITTGLDRKFTTKPARKKPSPAWTAPTIRPRAAARTTYCSVPNAAMAPTLAATKIESMATGPTARCREVPSTTYARIGARDA